jgi:hypothetical protein
VRPFEASVVAISYTHFAVDRAGNSYLYSYYSADPQKPADFDFTSGTDLHSTVAGADVFVTAVGPDGSYRYTRTYGNGGLQRPGDIALDSAGDVYLSGIFQGTVDFDFGPGTAQLYAGPQNVDAYFLTKLNKDGSFGWVRQTDSFFGKMSRGPAGAISAIGFAKSGSDVDYGPGVDIPAPGCTTTKAGCNGRSVQMIVAADGSYVRSYFTPDNMMGIFTDVDYDAQGRAYQLGEFLTGTIGADFDDSSAEALQKSRNSDGNGFYPQFDPFVRQLAADGTYRWAHHPATYQAVAAPPGCAPTAIRVTSETVFVGGYYLGALADGDLFTVVSGGTGGGDAFVYAEDLDGHMRWGVGLGSVGAQDMLARPLFLDVADDGRVTVAGMFEGTADLDLSNQVNLATAPRAAAPATFIVSFDPVDCAGGSKRACDCPGGQQGTQTCGADAQWGACGSCTTPTAPTVCIPNCSSPAAQCGAVASGCTGALDCGVCPASATCAGGDCTLQATTTLASGLNHPDVVAVDANHVYVLTRGTSYASPSPAPTDSSVLRVSKANGTVETLATGARLNGLVIDGSYAYWVDPTANAIMRFDKAAGTAATAWVSGVTPSTLADDGGAELAYLAAGKLYFVDKSTGTVGLGTPVPSNAVSPMVMDSSKVFIGNADPAVGYPQGTIYQVTRGSNTNALFGAANTPISLALDATYVYYASGDDTQPLMRRPRDGSAEQPLTASLGLHFAGVATANGSVFATLYGNRSQSTWDGVVLQINATTLAQTPHARLLNHPTGLAFDGLSLYVAESGPSTAATSLGTIKLFQ